MQWYCLECFAEVGNDDRRCAACGADLMAQDREHFGRKLVRALGHRLSDRRILAARALGARGDPEAVPALIRAAEDDDPYVAAEAVRALASIGDRSGLELVRRMAHGEGSVVVKAAAREALRLAGETPAPQSRHRPDSERGARGPAVPAFRFVLVFGVISALGDIVYEGGRSVYGPFLASLGGSALLVSLITGGGEAVALVFRLLFGRLADRADRRWALALWGYGLTMVAVPLLGLTRGVGLAAALMLAERFGKAIRSPAKDSMLAQAGTVIGRGWAFAVHEALDQVGAFIGPLIVAGAIAVTGAYGPGFLVLAVPGVAVMAVLVGLRARVPDASVYEDKPVGPWASSDTGGRISMVGRSRLPRRYWAYAAFTSITMIGYTTFGLLAFHLATTGLVSVAVIPVIYAFAMAADAIAALAAGRLYDRIGLRGLIVLPVLAALVPWLGFGSSAPLAILGFLIWGAAMGIQESSMRAAVADLAPSDQRGSAYGTFTACYGLAWLAGSALIGVLYDVSTTLTAIVVTFVQGAALLLFLRIGRGRAE
jgi:MFS family permease